MPQIKPEVESFARIKVIGVGGSGKNTVNHMVNSKVKGVDFIAVNTDAQDLHHSLAKKKIHIGKNLTRGLGTGMNPELGKRAVEETKEEVQEAIKGADMVFITGGMGGGTGSGAAPVVARTAKEGGCLTVAVVTKPFFFEGQQRMKIAESAIEELKQSVDALIVIPNDRLLQTIEKNVSAREAFAICDNILKEAVEGISDLITTPGIINIDFADIRSVLENSGAALMGIGSGTGENRAADAARAAISSPLLEISINGAKGVLFSIAGGDDLTMFEIQDAAKVITESVDPNAKIIFGTVRDDKLKKGEVKITVIASSFPETYQRVQAKAASLFQNFSHTEKEEERAVSQKGKIFNTIAPAEKPAATAPTPAKENISDVKPPVQNTRPAAQASPALEDDDDWSAVPAFLRRSKLK